MSAFADLQLAIVRAEACASAARARGHDREAAFFAGRAEGLRTAASLWPPIERCSDHPATSAGAPQMHD